MKIAKLIKQGRTVFSIDDLAMIWQISDRRQLVETIKYYLRSGQLKSVYRGVYALDSSYSPLEAAQKIFPPCYISYHTALAMHGINFQYYETIHCMASKTKNVQLNERKIIFHQLKENLLLQDRGIIRQDNYHVATPERAVIDALYLDPHTIFDNLASIDPDQLVSIAKLYGKNSIIQKIHTMLEDEHA